jgi:hypothetical protein
LSARAPTAAQERLILVGNPTVGLLSAHAVDPALICNFSVSFSVRAAAGYDLSALATSKAWSRVNAAREIVAAGVSGEW